MTDVKHTAERISTERLAKIVATGGWVYYGWPQKLVAEEAVQMATELQSLRASIPGGVGMTALGALLDEFASDIEGLAMLEYMAGSAPSRDQVEQAKSDIANTRQRILSALNRSPVAGEPVAWCTADVRGRMAEATDVPVVVQAWRDLGYTVRPLYAAPPNPVVSDEMVERAARKFVAHQHGQNLDEYGDGTYSRGIKHSMCLALNAALSANPQSAGDN